MMYMQLYTVMFDQLLVDNTWQLMIMIMIMMKVMTTTNDLVICSFICNHYPKLYGSYNAPTLWSIRNPFSTNTPIPSCTPWFERPRWRNRQSDSWWLRLQGAPDATTTQLWALFWGAVKVKAVRKFHEPSWQMWRQQEEANFSIIIIS